VIESPRAAGDGPSLPEASFDWVDELADIGVRALVTRRLAGDFNLGGAEPVAQVMGRWNALRSVLGASGPESRFASSLQVHGSRILQHQPGWTGWLRADAADGHFTTATGTGLAVTIADCVPVFVAHPTGAIALVHAGWRGTADNILPAVLAVYQGLGMGLAEVRVHLGPAICGRCYEVGPDVYARLTGLVVRGPRPVDLRALLTAQARSAGVAQVSVSSRCTRCDNDVFYSHRAGDAGRQVAAIIASA
jgi:YfiH family protein